MSLQRSVTRDADSRYIQPVTIGAMFEGLSLFALLLIVGVLILLVGAATWALRRYR